jgi:protein TonB
MMNQTLHDYRRHFFASLVGLPLAVGILITIPLLSAVSYQMPQIAPIMVLDFIEMPKKKAAVVKKPVVPQPKPSEKPEPPPPKSKRPRVTPKKPLKVKEKIVPKIPDQPSLKASLKKRPEKVVEEKDLKEEAVAPEVSAVTPEPVVPVPIFKLSSMPRFLHREAPVFPEKMKKLGRSATVKLQALIDKDGNVRKVIVETSAGPEFDKAAVTALKNSSFLPGMQEGKPVAVMLRLPVRFRLL